MKKLAIFLLALLLTESLFFVAKSKTVVAASVVQNVEYSLPYPGLLPNSPVYFLKVLRDKIVTWTIRDPEQKAFYLLLLSDKRLAAGAVLINFGKGDLGVNTLVQAEEYFQNSVALAEKLPKEKRGNLVAKLMVAVAKHTQVLGEVSGKITATGQKFWQTSVDDNTKSQSRVMDLYLQK